MNGGDQECETCGGERVVIDEYSANGRDVQEQLPCPDCTSPDHNERDPEDHVRGEVREPDVLRSELAAAAARGDADRYHAILVKLPPASSFEYSHYDAADDLHVYRSRS